MALPRLSQITQVLTFPVGEVGVLPSSAGRQREGALTLFSTVLLLSDVYRFRKQMNNDVCVCVYASAREKREEEEKRRR